MDVQASFAELTHIWSLLFSSKQKFSELRQGALGDGAGNVNVVNLPGWSWIRYDSNPHKVSQVINRFQNWSEDTRVIVGKEHPDDAHEQVLFVDLASYGYNLTDAMTAYFATQAHGETHLISSTDPAYISVGNVVDGKVWATYPISTSVDASALLYKRGCSIYNYTGGSINLAAHIPLINGHRYVLIYLNNAGVLSALAGDIYAAAFTPVPPDPPDTASVPLALVELTFGNVAITTAMIHSYKIIFDTVCDKPAPHTHSSDTEGGTSIIGLDEFMFDCYKPIYIESGKIIPYAVYHELYIDAMYITGLNVTVDLTTIEPDPVYGCGQILVLKPASPAIYTTYTINIRHGVGNIFLSGKTDIVLDEAHDHLILIYDGTYWCDFIDGSGGGGLAVHTHANAGQGGQLDWDNIWSDAIHDHSSNAEGGKITQLWTPDGTQQLVRGQNAAGGYLEVLREIHMMSNHLVTDNDGDTWVYSPGDDCIAFYISGDQLDLTAGLLSPPVDGQIALGTDLLRYNKLTLCDIAFVGLGSAAGRIVFNDLATDVLSFMACKVGVGTDTVPHGGIGAALSALDGANASVAGPHLQFTTETDDYPLMQIFNYSHDVVEIIFDSYWDGAWKSSDAGSNFAIAKVADLFRFRYSSGNAQGAVLVWTDGIILNTSGDVYPGTNKSANLGLTGNRWNTLYQGTSTAAGTSRTFASSRMCPVCKTQMIRGTGSLCILGEDRDYELAMCPECGCVATEEMKHLPTDKLSQRLSPPKIKFCGFKVFQMSGNSRKVRVDFKYADAVLDDSGETVTPAITNSTYLGEHEIDGLFAATPDGRRDILYELGLREWYALEETRLMEEEVIGLQAGFDALQIGGIDGRHRILENVYC